VKPRSISESGSAALVLETALKLNSPMLTAVAGQKKVNAAMMNVQIDPVLFLFIVLFCTSVVRYSTTPIGKNAKLFMQ
jgi:hypothetical protein